MAGLDKGQIICGFQPFSALLSLMPKANYKEDYFYHQEDQGTEKKYKIKSQNNIIGIYDRNSSILTKRPSVFFLKHKMPSL